VLVFSGVREIVPATVGTLVPAALFAERRDHEAALKNSTYNRQRQAPLHSAYNSRQDVPLVNHYGVTLVFPFFPTFKARRPAAGTARAGAAQPVRRIAGSSPATYNGW
jgi:hypothetical protein